MASRLSRLSFSRLLLVFVAAMGATALVAAVLFSWIGRNSVPFWERLRLTLAAVADPGDLLRVDDESLLYYLVAVVVTLVGVILPVLVLGAFVFKLFQRDPLVWRRKFSLETEKGGDIACFRFYNGTTTPLVNVTVRALARIDSPGRPRLRINNPLQFCLGDQLVDSRFFATTEPAMPFTVRVPVEVLGTSPTVNGDTSVRIGDQAVTADRVEFLIVATGTEPETGTSFVSMHSYPMSSHSILGHFQEVDVDTAVPARQWQGWHNFDGNCNLYVFGYGSLVNAGSIAQTLQRPLSPTEGPFEADLKAWVREWNVGSDASTHPERVWEDERGQRFTGVTTYLGLREQPDDSCNGAVFQVSNRDLALLDVRERNYRRVDVTRQVTWAGKPDTCAVYTYVPLEQATARFREALSASRAVVRREYWDLLTSAFAALSDSALKRFRATTPEPPCPVVHLRLMSSSAVVDQVVEEQAQ
jgi:cation transport regulator ChaC